MKLTADIDIKPPSQLIEYPAKIFLIGSCFTSHIGNALKEAKFSVMQNPYGILFDPASIIKSLQHFIQNHQAKETDVFELNELWTSWNHHSQFSDMDRTAVLNNINRATDEAYQFLQSADYLFITIGSAFSYRLTRQGVDGSLPNTAQVNDGVANCHRAPATWFQKHLTAIDEIVAGLKNILDQLKAFNPKLEVIFTISPVRHLRDGVVDNNRSKARLIEAVHSICQQNQNTYYFPAYEIVIDVLRDYRFYDVDFAHPNYLATEIVMDYFVKNCIGISSQQLMKEIKELVIASKHRALHPKTIAHNKFLETHLQKAVKLQNEYGTLNFENEINYFKHQLMKH